MSRDPRYDDPSGPERVRVDHSDERHSTDEQGRGTGRAQAGNWAAFAALICGVAGLITLFLSPPLGLLLALAAVVLGIIGLVKARSPYVGGAAQSIIGLVTGAIALLLTALLIWGITALFQNAEFQQQLEEQIQELQGEAGE